MWIMWMTRETSAGLVDLSQEGWGGWHPNYVRPASSLFVTLPDYIYLQRYTL